MKIFEIKDEKDKFTTLVVAANYGHAEELYADQIGKEIDTIKKREEQLIMEILITQNYIQEGLMMEDGTIRLKPSLHIKNT